MKEIIKKYWMVAVIVIAACTLLMQKCKIERLNDQAQLQNVELSTFKDSVAVLVSKNGELTFKVQSVQVESDNAKKALELAGFEIKELRQRDINWRKVNFALRAELEAAGSGTITLRDTTYIKGDTIMAKTGKWNNGYLYLNPFIVKNKMDFTYSYNIGLKIVSETKRKTNIVSIFSTDPNAKITTSNSITIENKLKWYEKPWVWGIAGIGAGYLIFKN
jgi:hypothetical protein